MILFSAVYKFQDRLSKNLAAFRMPPQEERGLPNILLTTVCRPFGGPGEGDSVGAELFHAQVTREQGIFSYRQVIRCWGLDYIAENIQAPTVVLHYPSEREFVRELKSHPYDYVGINFVVATFNKVKRMAGLIRRHSPKAKIILGGYGTVLNDEQLYPLGDHICREEGVGFMRRLLGEDVTQPIRHPYAPIESPRGVTITSVDPRAYGTFPLVLGEYVRKRKVLSWEEAIKKMTSNPARAMGLKDRGMLKKGFWADIVVFNPETIAHRANFKNCLELSQGINHNIYPIGIEYIIVNGVVVVEKGKLTGARSGHILRHKTR